MYIYNEVIEVMNERFPLLKPIYTNSIDEYEGLPYIYFESVVYEYILNKIHKNEYEELKSIFKFVEDLLQQGDEQVKNLIEVSIIENLYLESDFEEINKIIFEFYGTKTKVAFDNCN